MDFGKKWDKEKKLAFKNEGDAEKMLELYIYNHMEKNYSHDIAEIFAKEANIDTSQLVEIEENMLTGWWQVFWRTLCSRLLNIAGVNAQSSGQQTAFGKEWDKEKKLAMKNEGDAQKMLELYIYDHMKKKNLHDVADIFAKEANVETSQLVEMDENLLKEWWEVFWPTFCSKLSIKAGGSAQSSGQSSIGNSQEMLSSMKNYGPGSTRQAPMVNVQPNALPEFSTAGSNACEDNRNQMPLTGGEESDGSNPVSPRTHVPAFYVLLMVLYIVRTER